LAYQDAVPPNFTHFSQIENLIMDAIQRLLFRGQLLDDRKTLIAGYDTDQANSGRQAERSPNRGAAGGA
jgi:hypothetical protein